ncbi:insulinase family protein [bacterium]|nr:insulinase family protein [bacterium]
MKQTLLSATLDNGIVLLGEELPDLESVAVAFHAPAGGIHDGEGRCGLASLTSEMMLRGAGDRDSRQLVEDLAMAGINWSNAVSTTHAMIGTVTLLQPNGPAGSKPSLPPPGTSSRYME